MSNIKRTIRRWELYFSFFNIKKYRKLNNIVIDLDSPINIISGTNGTCKSSILYLVSNAFQELKSTTEWLKSKDV